MIDTRLITLLTLVETKSYTKTAEILYITQPAVTHHIKSIEKENNVKLFTNTKTFKLSQAGQLIFDYATKAVEQYHQLKLSLEMNLSPKRKIDFVVTNQIASSFIKPVILGWMDKHTADDISMQVLPYKTILDKINDGIIDFAIIDHSFDKTKYDYFQIFRTSIILVVGNKHPLAHKQKIRLEQLFDENIIVDRKSSGLRMTLENALVNKNVIFDSYHLTEIDDPYVAKDMIMSSKGIGFLYQSSVSAELEDGMLHQIQIQDFEVMQDFYLIASKNSLTKDRYKEISEEIISINRDGLLK